MIHVRSRLSMSKSWNWPEVVKRWQNTHGKDRRLDWLLVMQMSCKRVAWKPHWWDAANSWRFIIWKVSFAIVLLEAHNTGLVQATALKACLWNEWRNQLFGLWYPNVWSYPSPEIRSSEVLPMGITNDETITETDVLASHLIYWSGIYASLPGLKVTVSCWPLC